MLYLSCDLSLSKYNTYSSRAGVEVDSPFFLFPLSLLGFTIDFLFWPFTMVGVDTTNALETFFNFVIFDAIDGSKRVMKG